MAIDISLISFILSFDYFKYYETLVLTFEDDFHPDITVVVVRNEARRTMF